MKPDWKDAPEWAQYVAMDFGGSWYWYADRPTYQNGCWNHGWRIRFAALHKPASTLEQRP